MAIQRTSWEDDDGTGTTGTVINNAEKTLLYDQIDAALVGYLPVNPSGYLTRDLLWSPDATYDIGKSAANRPRDVFCSRNLTAGGLLTMNGGGDHFLIGTLAGPQGFTHRNLSNAGNASAVTYVQAGSGGDVRLSAYAAGYASSGFAQADGSALMATGAGGLSILANHVSGAIRFYSGGSTERMQLDSGGNVWIGGPLTSPYNPRVHIAADFNSRNALVLQNVSGTVGGQFVVFVNSSATLAGTITQSTATTVSYNTSSDQRLKRDYGRATESPGLRTVVVHDFAWIDGGQMDRGIFAQETAPIFPRAITVGSDGDDLSRPWMTDYSKFVPDLIVGWQDHDRRLAHLETLLMERTAA